MSSLLKPNNRNKLFALLIIISIGSGLFFFYGNKMIGEDTATVDFSGSSASSGDTTTTTTTITEVLGQCIIHAWLGAYDVDGNLIEKKILQSGYTIGGIEVAKLVFHIDLTIIGDGVDWNTFDADLVDLVLYPNGQDPIHTGDNLLTMDTTGDMNDNIPTGYAEFTLWDQDYALSDNSLVYFQEALGDPVETYDNGNEIYLFQMMFDLEAHVSTSDGTTIENNAHIVASWELVKTSDGQMDAAEGDNGVNDGAIADQIKNIISHDVDINNTSNIIVDRDVAPDIRIFPGEPRLCGHLLNILRR